MRLPIRAAAVLAAGLAFATGASLPSFAQNQGGSSLAPSAVGLSAINAYVQRTRGWDAGRYTVIAVESAQWQHAYKITLTPRTGEGSDEYEDFYVYLDAAGSEVMGEYEVE